MKFIKNTVTLAGYVVLILSIAGCGKKSAEEFEQSTWDSMATEQLSRNLESYFSSGTLPAGQEKSFLVWAFQKDPELVEGYIREHATRISSLAWYMSDGAWDLVKEQEIDSGLRLLTLAQELFPNDPDVLGITGIITYLRGDQATARKFLEEAESWRSNRPIVDFYLGGILILSESTADRTRGKAILMKLVGGSDEELRELAGLTLLTNPGVPMIPQDFEYIHDTLQGHSVFRTDNPNIHPEALRIIINRMARQFPEKAMALTDLLMESPEVNVEDTVGTIRLAQSLGLGEKSRTLLDGLQANSDFMAHLEDDPRLPQLVAIQDFMEESYESGMEGMKNSVRDPEVDSLAIQRSFQTIMRNELPVNVEGELLRLYLELPVNNVPTSINILNRLVQIDPLDTDTWIAYAIDELLANDPVRTGSWLTQIDASEAVINALSADGKQLSPNEALILINAYIAEEDVDRAEASLNASRGLIEPIMDSYFRARILSQKGELEEAFTYWEEAHQGVLNSNRFPLMKNLGILAIQLEQPVNAMQALYTAFSAGIPFNQAEATELIQLTLRFGNLRQAIHIAERLAENFPESPLHKNNLAYFKFLAEEQVEESVEVMRELVDDYPDIPQFRLTMALGLLKSGRTNEANRLLKSTDIDWESTSTRGLLIYAVVLAASNQQTVAEGLLQNLDLEGLIPEEKALLEAY